MEIQEILKQYWGYEEFRPLQEEIILSVLSGKDTLALMPTGGGKSITYQIPALAMEGVCIVITPLIALMKDQVEELQKRRIAAEAIYTGLASEVVETAINKAKVAKVKFLYLSPERLASKYFREQLKQMPVSILAVDEAHCISQWGYDFRPSYLQIAEVRSFFPNVPVLALTATATPEVVVDIQDKLKFAKQHVLSKSFRRENISYVVRKANDKLGELVHILSKLQTSGIVYVRKRATAEELVHFLTDKGIVADYYHAGLTSFQRVQKQERWKKGEVQVIVATNAFGMGIDKPDVRIVVHFDIPDSPEAYFQEAGRAGRDGKKAYAVLLYNEATLTALKKRIDQAYPEKKYIREVYQALANFFCIEEGTGKGMAFEFDPDVFVKTFKLDYVSALAAIEILQVSGYLECTTDIHSQSRITFLVLRDQLYKIELEDELTERLVELVLRTCAGIFVQYAYIDESYFAERLGVNRDQLYHALLNLAKRRIINYIPGNDRPYIVYHQPRVPASYLHISRNAYEDRKESYAKKVRNMVDYVEDQKGCRQLYLMAYLGQTEKYPCGICDHCLEEKKRIGKSEQKATDQKIMALLQQGNRELRELILLTGEEREWVVGRIRYLLETEKIIYKSPILLGLPE